jgi:cyclopropane fatty-acyl-phospholipid synthase-like methyltransferase
LTRSNVWENFYNHNASTYMQGLAVRNTVNEVDFMLEVLGLKPGHSVLDIGCGTGRHCVEFARRGLQVTGVDISSGMLQEARKAAEKAQVDVEWVQCDATQFSTSARYDAAVCLCEGAFGLFSMDDDPDAHSLSILKNTYDALKSNGHFILTSLNAYAKIREYTQDDVESGIFDPITMVRTEELLNEGGISLVTKERRYTPPELVRLLQKAGFTVEHVWGGTAGNWGRRKIELDEVEVMYVCRNI